MGLALAQWQSALELMNQHGGDSIRKSATADEAGILPAAQ